PAAFVDRLEATPTIAGYLLQTTLAGLSGAARGLLAQLAVFRHPVDLLDKRLTGAMDGPSGPLGGLEELRRRQLVDNAARASLHPLVHDYVYAWAVSAADRAELHRVAAAHCEQVLADPLEAGWHYAQAGDAPHAAALLTAHAPELTASGRS